MSLNQALNQYQQVSNQQAVDGASPHRLIQMLLEGAIQRMAEAKGAMQRGEVANKGVAIGKAISIVGGLSDSLNLEVPGDLSENLQGLYQYAVDCLMEANLKNDQSKIDDALKVIKTIKEGWDGIAEEVK